MSRNLCQVSNCQNSRQKAITKGISISFFRFPKNERIRQEWIKRCNKDGTIMISESGRVCSAHFTTNDFVRDLKSELLNLPPKRLLNEGAIPSVAVWNSSEIQDSSLNTETFSNIKPKKKNNNINILKNNKNIGDKPVLKLNPTMSPLLVGKKHEEYKQLKKNFASIMKINENFTRENKNLKEIISKQGKQLKEREIEIIRLRKAIKEIIKTKVDEEQIFKKHLSGFFTRNQIDTVLKIRKNNIRTTQEIMKAIAFSEKDYKFVTDTMNYPLPGILTPNARNFLAMDYEDDDDEMNDIQLVDIDPSGVFKYVLINLHSDDQNGEELAITIVRGYARATWHNIFEEVQQSLQPLNCECIGGGRLNHKAKEKKIHVYGYSKEYGTADHEITAELLKEVYKDYEISISGEG